MTERELKQYAADVLLDYYLLYGDEDARDASEMLLTELENTE